MEIRRPVLSDIPALVALNRIVHAIHASAFPVRFRPEPPDTLVADVFKEAIESPLGYWLLAHDGEAMGFLSAEFRERAETWCVRAHRVCYVSGVVVRPDFRRKGVARALLTELKREASARGIVQIELDVWRFNEHAKRAFLSLGFVSIMERMSFSAEQSDQALEPMPALGVSSADLKIIPSKNVTHR